MLWLALYFPRLSIELIEQAHRDVAQASTTPSPSALALANKTHILASNAVAAHLGVQAGIKRATALALAPDLKLFTQEPQREQQALEALALWALDRKSVV